MPSAQTENGELEAESLPGDSPARELLAGAGPALVQAVRERGSGYEPVLSGVLLMAGGALLRRIRPRGVLTSSFDAPNSARPRRGRSQARGPRVPRREESPWSADPSREGPGATGTLGCVSLCLRPFCATLGGLVAACLSSPQRRCNAAVLQVRVNIRMCVDCHALFAAASAALVSPIVCVDGVS